MSNTKINNNISLGVVSSCCGAIVKHENKCTCCEEHCIPVYANKECKSCGCGVDLEGRCVGCGKVDCSLE